MLIIGFMLLCLAVLLGAALAAINLRPERNGPPPAALRATHGTLGALGVLSLAVLLRAQGWHATTVAWDAEALLAIALASGASVWLFWRPLGGARGMVLVLHGFAAVVGFTLVLGWGLGG